MEEWQVLPFCKNGGIYEHYEKATNQVTGHLGN